eukprot:GILI01021544.1.p1 GENE.GILI01021544.1~~GILI01021544.1.p1  ORF type:complete len:196 (+),score=56.68 GILI01021544.1:55-588(+)
MATSSQLSAMDALLEALNDGSVQIDTVTVAAGGTAIQAAAGGSSRSLESLMMTLGQELSKTDNKDWIQSKPIGEKEVGASSQPTTSIIEPSAAATGSNESESLDDLVMKVQKQLREGGDAARATMAAANTNAVAAASADGSKQTPPPPKTKEEYDAMSLNELCEELAKVQAGGIKLV